MFKKNKKVLFLCFPKEIVYSQTEQVESLKISLEGDTEWDFITLLFSVDGGRSGNMASSSGYVVVVGRHFVYQFGGNQLQQRMWWA